MCFNCMVTFSDAEKRSPFVGIQRIMHTQRLSLQNVRMAEVICGYESGERKHTHCATIRATTAAEVQTTSPFTKVLYLRLPL